MEKSVYEDNIQSVVDLAAITEFEWDAGNRGKNLRHLVSDAETEQVFPVSSQWFDNTRQVQGSWWPDWSEWLASHAGKKVRAKKTAGNGTYPELEPAPGKYVKVKAV